MISSKAVDPDAEWNHVNSPVPPGFSSPIRETQPTVAAGDAGDAARTVAAEQVLLDSGGPVTVIRTGLIPGAEARMPCEGVVVKRVLDRRPAILLTDRGAGVAQTTAAANIGAPIEVVAAAPGRRILKVADPDAASAREIGRSIAGQLGHGFDEVLLDSGADAGLGRHLWEPLGGQRSEGDGDHQQVADHQDENGEEDPRSPIALENATREEHWLRLYPTRLILKAGDFRRLASGVAWSSSSSARRRTSRPGPGRGPGGPEA